MHKLQSNVSSKCRGAWLQLIAAQPAPACMKPTDINGGLGLTVHYVRLFTIAQAEHDQNKWPLYGIVGCPLLMGFE